MLISKLQQITSGQFIRNVGWLGGAELLNRLFRLGTTVTLARLFSAQDYGLMAIIYTTFEFANVLTLRGGIGAKIIQADEKDVPTFCNTSYWLNWMLCGAVFIVQCAAAFPIARFYDNNRLILPLCTMALMYLTLPLFLINTALIERENRLKITALCNAAHSFLVNLITISLALLGLGIWAIVWSMVLSMPVWILITWRNHPWRPPTTVHLERWQEIARFAKNLLGVDLLTRLRLNLDYLIVGKFLGIEELGIYYFAFNAGSGITMNVVNSLMLALYPHLCLVRQHTERFKARYLSSLKTIALIVVPLVLLQSTLAPFYVPLIFGEKWTSAIPVLMLICLSVIPRTFKWAASLLFNATDRTHLTLTFDLGFTLIFAAALFIAVQSGVLSVAMAVLTIYLLSSLSFNIFAWRQVFAKH
ncbi:MAG: lipopolysaccharide biosynthesis protein [Cyanophyceae cyanobacterium]